MRFNFSLTETSKEDSRSPTPTTPSTPAHEIEWLSLQRHPLFTGGGVGGVGGVGGGFSEPSYSRARRNLLACDGASRLYFWDSGKQCLHRLTIRLGEPDPTSVLAASSSKVLIADVQLNYAVTKVCINRNGSSLLLVGSAGLHVMNLFGRNSAKDKTTICRTVPIGSSIYCNSDNSIRILQVFWHPCSDTHLGILSSDSVFRIFDLSFDSEQPEQEFYLQPVERGRSRNAASICPVDFSFGGDHLWDRFSVFLLFSDGSVYILCPVVPFGSVYKWGSVSELYSDAQTFGLNPVNSTAVSNSSLAVSWLEASFPELTQQLTGGASPAAVKARPYALFDASLLMQGPLGKVCHGGEDGIEYRVADSEGSAVSLLYDAVGKDSILVTAYSGGKLQIDALADEIQPLWNVGSLPRLSVDSSDRIIGVAMICESNPAQLAIIKLDQPAWSGHPPPLLSLNNVDLALPKNVEVDPFISIYLDPLISERIYAVHDGGVDSIVLHYLPFTNQMSGKDGTMRSPTVNPVLSTCQGGEAFSGSALTGFVSLCDSFGYSWIVGITSSQECVVLEMKTWNILFPIHVDMERKPMCLEESTETDKTCIISKELLSGPKTVIIPSTAQNLRSVAADSIEGRSTLHQYFKLFHEIYVEYAHKVYLELKHHGSRHSEIIGDLHGRFDEAKQKLLKLHEKQLSLDERVVHAIQQHGLLDERLQRLRNLPGAHKNLLSKAEREFKTQLDRLTGVELAALRSSIEALGGRLKRCTPSLQKNAPNNPRQLSARTKNYAQETQISQLRSFAAKLSLVNSENSKKIKIVESELRGREASSS